MDSFGVKPTFRPLVKVIQGLLFELYHVFRVHVNGVHTPLTLADQRLSPLYRASVWLLGPVAFL